MKLSKIKLPLKVAPVISKAGFAIRKHSPEILIVAGVASTVTSVVLACVATTKVEKELEVHQMRMNKVADAVENPADYGNYTEEDRKKDTITIYTQTILRVARHYLPAAIALISGITAILWSHNIMQKRNASLAFTAAAISKSYDEYRARVADRFGEDAEKELRYNIKTEKMEETVTDENGKTKKKKTDVKVQDGPLYSPYARIFDQLNPNFEKEPEINKMFLRRCERLANDKLRIKGFLFLNEVYDMLGFEPSKIGQSVGWIYDPTSKDSCSYIDFGMYDTQRQSSNDFINGLEAAVVLDFNVDGNIIHKAKFSREV